MEDLLLLLLMQSQVILKPTSYLKELKLIKWEMLKELKTLLKLEEAS